MYRPNSIWTWTFTAIVFVQLVIVLSLESYVFALFDETLRPQAASSDNAASTKALPTFLSLFMFGMFYQLVLVWDALRLKNTIQVIGLCLYNIGLLIYAIVQIDQIFKATQNLQGLLYNDNIWTALKPSLIVVPCMLGLGTVAMLSVAWTLYDEFAWTIYKHISADLRMKRRYLTFQIYITLLKFDFFFFLGFTVQFLVNVVNPRDVEFALTAVAIPITILILWMAAYFARRENKAGMVVIIFFYFAALAYFTFKLVRMFTPPKMNDYKAVLKPLTSFAVITIILIILTIANAIACTMNFNKGLKPHVTSRKVDHDDEKGSVTEMPNLAHAPVPSRMTID